jgi:hypothetical protein
MQRYFYPPKQPKIAMETPKMKRCNRLLLHKNKNNHLKTNQPRAERYIFAESQDKTDGLSPAARRD